MKFIVSTLAVAAILTACGKVEIPADQLQVTSSEMMQQQVAAIKSCMDQGLSEETCASVHKQMSSGTLTGSPTMAACESQYGVGQCGSVPVASSNGSSHSIILPLVLGAAAGYIAHSWITSNSAPVGAVAPTRAWLENKPAVYQQSVERERTKPTFIQPLPSKSQQAKSFAVQDGYSQKKVTMNGNAVAGANKVPLPQPATPGAVRTEPVKQTQVAPAQSAQQRATVEYKAPTTGYAQQSRQTSAAPSYSYKSPSPSPSRSSSRR